MTTTLARPSDPRVSTPSSVTSIDAVSTEIRELAMRISVATARLLYLIGEFDATEAWADYGMKSCAHWLSWQCHISPHTAREHVRIARRLRELPMIATEFSIGGLSYAKVRALTRIADPDCEVDLIALAKAATASQVERTVAGWRRTETITPDERAARRRVSWSFDEDGMLRLHALLDAEEGAVLVAALEAARAHLAHSRVATNPAEGASSGPDLSGGTTQPIAADALAAVAEAYLAGGDSSGHDAETPARRHTELVVIADAEVLQRRAGGGVATYQSGGTLTELQLRQFACDTRLITILKDGRDVLDVGRATRTVPRRMRRAAFARDGGCAMPGCTEHRPDRLHAHHVIHWADGGPTALDNLVTLCAAHHWAVHHDQLSIHAKAGRFIYRTADGATLAPVPALPDLPADVITLPLAPSPGDPRQFPTSSGDPFDLDYILTVLKTHRQLRRDQHRADAPLAA